MDKKKDNRDLSGEIWVNDFNEESAQRFREKVVDAALEDPLKPIIIYIDSYGGQVDSLAKMIETMDEVTNPFVTVCHGKAMSCGAALLSHGDVRFCGKHSRIMVHEVSSGTSGNVHDMKTDVQEGQRLNKYFMGLLARNCGIRGGYDALRKMIKEQDGRDRYLDADAAVKFGIVDAVGTPILNSAYMYEISLVPTKTRMRKTKTRKMPAAKKKSKGKTDTTKR